MARIGYVLLAALVGIPAGVGAFTFVYARGFSCPSTVAAAIPTAIAASRVARLLHASETAAA